MSLIAKDTGKDFIPAPAGLHAARLVELVDLGEQRKEYLGKITTQHRIRFVFQIQERMPENGLAYTVSAWHNLTLAEKSTLRPFLESWLGRRLTETETAEGIDLETLLDRTAYIQLIHTERKGAVYADITNIMPLPADVPFHFPEYVRMSGEVVQDELVRERGSHSNGDTSRTSERAGTTARQRSERVREMPSRGTKLKDVQQLGTTLYGRQWPAARARILGELGLEDRIESFDEEKLETVLERLQVEADEMEERAAA